LTNFEKLPPECDWLCKYRGCLHSGENKGSYTAGRGYTSYHTPEYVCLTRHVHGCPEGPKINGEIKRPEPDWGKMVEALAADFLQMKRTKKVDKKVNQIIGMIGAMLSYRE